MPIAAHTIQSSAQKRKRKKRVGRGNASGKGTYAGRGLKGQRARSGGRGGLKRKGFKQSLQKVPKKRGFTSIAPKAQTVTLRTLQRVAGSSDVTPAFLKQKKVIKDTKRPVKIVATGSLEKKLTIKCCLASKKAVELIEKAGGQIIF